MEPQSLTGVGKTALGVASVRARETRRTDRLFDDPYAQAFLAAAPEAFTEERAVLEQGEGAAGLAAVGAAFFLHGIIRTRFFDDYLLQATAGGCRQVVLLAAGLDTRAFRLTWPPGLRLFELDLPDVLAFKEHVLAGQGALPRCGRTILPIDLQAEWPAALTTAGFDPTAPTAWLAEGLLIYLTAHDATQLLARVDELSADRSQLSFEHGTIADSPLLAQAHAVPAMDQYTQLWKGGLGPAAPDWLTRHGWQVQTHDSADLATSYGRTAPDQGSGGFLTAIRAPS